jgi:hypothetical protein
VNVFRSPKWDAKAGEWHRPLDMKFLRVCAVYRLLKRKLIGKARGLELLAQRHTRREMNVLRATVELWGGGPIKDMLS